MAEYIERDELYIQIRKRVNNPAIRSWFGAMLAEIPAADVAPVKHGKWMSVDADVIFSCSNCENEVSTSWDYDAADMFTYCPCCGAKMDLKEEAK